jgi:hypothetical protein
MILWVWRTRPHRELTLRASPPYTALFPHGNLENPGQVAQLVERGPEKAGVGGSIPSLATKI